MYYHCAGELVLQEPEGLQHPSLPEQGGARFRLIRPDARGAPSPGLPGVPGVLRDATDAAAEGGEVLTPHPQPSTLNLKPQTLNPTPYTLNPQPSTLHPQP